MTTEHPAESTPTVGVVIVNWRASAITLEAVAQVLAQTVSPTRVFVVDNGSGDGSADTLRAAPPFRDGHATLIESPHNLGFGGGCNLALREIAATALDFAWLLNNDAMPAPDCLAQLLSAAASAPAPVGLVGSLLVDPQGEVEPHFGSWMKPLTLACGAIVPGTPDTHRYSWMTAASLLIAGPALKAVGGFDECFFMYWEDADLNLRIRKAGFSISSAPKALVEHHAGTSSSADTVRRYMWHFTSQDRFIAKHLARPQLARLRLRVKFLLKAAFNRDWKRLNALTRATIGIS